MTQSYEPRPKTRAFVEHLQGLDQRKERGALAALRRGLGRPPGDAPEMHRYVVAWADGERSRWSEDVYYVVAALFAYHPARWTEIRGSSNLGASFARLAQAKGMSLESVDRRFTVLLGAYREDLPQLLRHAVSLLKSRDVPVDWARLLDDLKWWDDDDRRVQRRWAKAFWGRQSEDNDQETDNTELENTESLDGPDGQ
jgi:CRISPR system Cascade subunit CasB